MIDRQERQERQEIQEVGKLENQSCYVRGGAGYSCRDPIQEWTAVEKSWTNRVQQISLTNSYNRLCDYRVFLALLAPLAVKKLRSDRADFSNLSCDSLVFLALLAPLAVKNLRSDRAEFSNLSCDSLVFLALLAVKNWK
jgi:hypothetical protein